MSDAGAADSRQPDPAAAAAGRAPDGAPDGGGKGGADARQPDPAVAGKTRRWRRDWKKPAHRASQHAKFFDDNGLAIFAVQWRESAELRATELQRRWVLQQQVTAVGQKAERASTPGQRVAGDPREELRKAEALLGSIGALAVQARGATGARIKLAAARYTDDTKTMVQASAVPVPAAGDEALIDLYDTWVRELRQAQASLTADRDDVHARGAARARDSTTPTPSSRPLHRCGGLSRQPQHSRRPDTAVGTLLQASLPPPLLLPLRAAPALWLQ